MSQVDEEKKLLERKPVDIIGLIPKRITDAIMGMGYYYFEPLDAYPFKARVKHKLGFECILEGETEGAFVKEAFETMIAMGPILEGPEVRDVLTNMYGTKGE